jgi:hypothetical protein
MASYTCPAMTRILGIWILTASYPKARVTASHGRFSRGVAVSSLIGTISRVEDMPAPEEIATAVKLPRDDTEPEEITTASYTCPAMTRNLRRSLHRKHSRCCAPSVEMHPLLSRKRIFAHLSL